MTYFLFPTPPYIHYCLGPQMCMLSYLAWCLNKNQPLFSLFNISKNADYLSYKPITVLALTVKKKCFEAWSN